MNRLPLERRAILTRFYSIYQFDNDSNHIATELERGCYQQACELYVGVPSFDCIEFKNRYSEVCYRVMYSLHPHMQPADLQDAVLARSINPANVAAMTAEELNPNANADIRNVIELRLKQSVERKICYDYICNRCGKNETTPYEYQARAADEGSTLSIKCLNPSCRNVWRM